MHHSGGVDYDTSDFLSRAGSSLDPQGLWISTPEDQFPDPKFDLDGFMIYCGESFGRLTAYLWLVTREMIESGAEIQPIATHEPFFFSKYKSTLCKLTSVFILLFFFSIQRCLKLHPPVTPSLLMGLPLVILILTTLPRVKTVVPLHLCRAITSQKGTVKRTIQTLLVAPSPPRSCSAVATSLPPYR